MKEAHTPDTRRSSGSSQNEQLELQLSELRSLRRVLAEWTADYERQEAQVNRTIRRIERRAPGAPLSNPDLAAYARLQQLQDDATDYRQLRGWYSELRREEVEVLAALGSLERGQVRDKQGLPSEAPTPSVEPTYLTTKQVIEIVGCTAKEWECRLYRARKSPEHARPEYVALLLRENRESAGPDGCGKGRYLASAIDRIPREANSNPEYLLRRAEEIRSIAEARRATLAAARDLRETERLARQEGLAAMRR